MHTDKCPDCGEDISQLTQRLRKALKVERDAAKTANRALRESRAMLLSRDAQIKTLRERVDWLETRIGETT